MITQILGSKILATPRGRTSQWSSFSCPNGHKGRFLFRDIKDIWVQVKTVSKEQHWVQHACEQIGLGSRRQLRTKAGKVAALFIFSQVHDMLSFRSEVECSCPTCLQCVPSSTRSSMWLTSPQSPFQMACLTISTRIPMASNLRLRENLLWRWRTERVPQCFPIITVKFRAPRLKVWVAWQLGQNGWR